MDESGLLQRIVALRRALGRGGAAGSKAPHQPLLLLILLSQVEQSGGRANRFSFAETKAAFDALWPRFGWTGETRAALPFWHLTSSGLWILHGREGPVDARGTKPPADGKVVQTVKYGAFADQAWKLLRQPEVRHRVMEFIIQQCFPESVHEELRLALGLPSQPEPAPTPQPAPRPCRRSAADQARFRDQVIRAYEDQCAICGFGPRNSRAPSAIQAAHVWPVEFGGPFEVENGLALCPMHHWALDSGTLGLTNDRRVLVSSKVFDGPIFESYLRAYSGRELRRPQPPFPTPATKFLELHRLRIFLGPERAGEPVPAAGPVGVDATEQEDTSRETQ